MRSEGDKLLESVEEVISIADKAGIPAHISHLKASGEKNWEMISKVFEMIDQAHNKNLSITCDRYPYIASSTDLDTLLPSWAFEGGRKKEIARLTTQREKLAKDIVNDYSEPADWGRVVISSVNSGKNKWMEGKSILEIARAQDKSESESVFDLLIDEDLNVGAIFFTMNEDNLRSILKRRYSVIGTDSAARSFDG
ncbi:MAG: D-aminoacylase, partial [Proteobacteria bacterium]|nr:D-aminoacylase [Pseudomonadota bacterium]